MKDPKTSIVIETATPKELLIGVVLIGVVLIDVVRKLWCLKNK